MGDRGGYNPTTTQVSSQQNGGTQINQDLAARLKYQDEELKKQTKDFNDKETQFNKMGESDRAYMGTATSEAQKYQQQRDDAARKYEEQQQQYLSNMSGSEGSFQEGQRNLRGLADTQYKDSAATYTNNIKPKMQGLMDQAYNNAQSAMTLKDAGDANNSVNQQWRDVYDKQATGEQNRGYQNYGVLAALGSQASQNTMGNGMPMTVGQQMSIQAANQRAAGEAFANTQQRMATLRDKGLDVGREESAAQYQRGQNAQQFAGEQTNNFFNAEGLQQQRLGTLRGEMGGYDTNILGSQTRMNDATMGVGQNQYQRGIGTAQENMNINTGLAADESNRIKSLASARLGDQAQTAALAQQQQAAQDKRTAAEQAAQAQMIGAGIGAVGTVAGGIVGGPVGAAAGGAAGNAAGQGIGNSMSLNSAGSQYNLGVAPYNGVYSQLASPYKGSLG